MWIYDVVFDIVILCSHVVWLCDVVMRCGYFWWLYLVVIWCNILWILCGYSVWLYDIWLTLCDWIVVIFCGYIVWLCGMFMSYGYLMWLYSVVMWGGCVRWLCGSIAWLFVLYDGLILLYCMFTQAGQSSTLPVDVQVTKPRHKKNTTKHGGLEHMLKDVKETG